MRHFLTLRDFTKEEILDIIALARHIKHESKKGEFVPYMEGKILAMIFEKSSTRTRVSFEAGIYQLGGTGMFLSSRDIQLGRGEPMKDTARVLSRMVDMVVIRTTDQARLEEFSGFSQVPVINGLTNEYHPLQLLADYMTMLEEGKGEDSKVAWIGDGNNMAHSWLMLASKLGFDLSIASPKGYEVDEKILALAQENAKKSGAKIVLTQDINEAADGADVITTDVWASMGQEEESQKRIRDFAGYIVDKRLMERAKKDAIFLHCLPAHRGEEVSEEVLESSQSKVFDEAENRLHAQKGVMVWLQRNIRD